MEVPLPLLIALITMAGGGSMTWMAYITKQIVEHAKVLAVVTYRLRLDDPAVARAAHGDGPAD
jgi:hypothetical protein